MAAIYLIRHGQASSGQDNYDQLSELGYRQARRLGEVLGSRLPMFDQVYQGGMLRHKQTAENCLSGFDKAIDDKSITVDVGWNEYDHQDILRQFRPEFVDAAGVNQYIAKQDNPKKAFEQDFNGAVDRWISGEYDQDYVESWSEFSTRVRAAFENVIKQSVGKKNVAVFTSGGPISLVTQALLGISEENIMQMNWTLLNCGVTKCVSTSSRVFLASLNEHAHFEGADYKSYLSYS